MHKPKRPIQPRQLTTTELVRAIGGFTITDGRVIGVRVSSADSVSPDTATRT